MSTFEISPKSYKAKNGYLSDVLNLLRLDSTNKEDYVNMKSLYQELIHILSSDTSDNQKVKSINHIIKTNKINNKLSNRYELTCYGFSKKRRDKFISKSEDFFNFLRTISENDKKVLIRKGIYMTSLFLTYLGVKPSCLIDKKIVSVLKKAPNSIFSNFDNIDNIFNKEHTLFYNPETLVKIANKNKDLFGSIKDRKDLKDFLKTHPISISFRSNEYKKAADYFYNHMRVGVLLGIPKREVLQFASKEKLICEYEKFLTYGSGSAYYDLEDEYYTLPAKPIDYKSYQAYKDNNIDKLKTYIPKSKQQKLYNIIEELAGRITIDFSSGPFNSDVKMYFYIGYSKRNHLFESSIKKIIGKTNFVEELLNLGF